jgi:hypothetical protein
MLKKGEKKFPNGDKYDGAFEENKFSGKGKLTMANGDNHDGEWKNGMKHGEGIFTMAKTGKQIRGVWENDAMKRIELPSSSQEKDHGIFV